MALVRLKFHNTNVSYKKTTGPLPHPHEYIEVDIDLKDMIYGISSEKQLVRFGSAKNKTLLIKEVKSKLKELGVEVFDEVRRKTKKKH